MADLGGFLIRFDEAQRSEFLREVRDLEEGFSDALSSADWPMKKWEVCGLLFEDDTVTHWALARRTHRFVTGKAKVEFTNVTKTNISLEAVEGGISARVRRNMVSARSGVGGRVPPATWRELKAAVGVVDGASLEILERLERLRDQSGVAIHRPGAEVVAQQRDATGLALDVFDRSGGMRRKALGGWAPSGGTDDTPMTSFLEGLNVGVIEDQIIALDAAVFPGTDSVRHSVTGAVFSLGGRYLEVFNVNRHRIETSLGVDLFYFHESYNAWTLVQYKVMEHDDRVGHDVYRPDDAFDLGLGRMRDFRNATPDQWTEADRVEDYRLCGDGFFLKFCERAPLVVLNNELIRGLYMPRQFTASLLADKTKMGPRGGRLITEKNAGRHISNTLFASLVRDGWVGTRGVSSIRIAELVMAAFVGQRAAVIARERPAGASPELAAMAGTLGLTEELG